MGRRCSDLRWWVGLVGLAWACADDGASRGGPPPKLGSNAESGTTAEGSTSGSGTGAGSSAGPDGEATAATGAGDAGSVSEGPSDPTGSSDVCAAEPTDIPCFACGKERCCEAYTACRADVQCECAVDCIEAGGMATPCNETCGQSEASTILLVCAYLNCEAECQGI